MDEVDPVDAALANYLMDACVQLLADAAEAAYELGTEVSLHQVIGVLLGTGAQLTEISRDDFMNIWTIFETHVLPSIQAEKASAAPRSGSPADITNARDAAEAERMTAFWDDVVSRAVFDFVNSREEDDL